MSETEVRQAPIDYAARRQERAAARRASSRRSGWIVAAAVVVALVVLTAAAEAVVTAISFGGEILILEELYGADSGGYAQAVRAVPDQCSLVLVIGHNPGLEEFLGAITGQRESMPTAAIAWLRVPIDKWPDLRLASQAELERVWRPTAE